MKIAPACSRCLHPAMYHEYDPLDCAHCALSPLAHLHGIGCSTYTLREAPASGARCNVPRCECFDLGGYRPREDDPPRRGREERRDGRAR